MTSLMPLFKYVSMFHLIFGSVFLLEEQQAQKEQGKPVSILISSAEPTFIDLSQKRENCGSLGGIIEREERTKECSAPGKIRSRRRFLPGRIVGNSPEIPHGSEMKHSRTNSA